MSYKEDGQTMNMTRQSCFTNKLKLNLTNRFQFSISKRELIQFKVRRLADLILEEKQKKEQKEKKENEEIKTRKDAERSSKVVSWQTILSNHVS